MIRRWEVIRLAVLEMEKEERLKLAMDPNTSVEILVELSRKCYGLQNIVLANPSTPDEVLLDAVEGCSHLYIYFRKALDYGDCEVLGAVLRHPNVSEVTLKYIWDKIVSTIPWSTRSIGTIVCELVEHPKTPKEILDQIWEKRHEHWEEEILLHSFAVSKKSTVKRLKEVQRVNQCFTQEIWENPKCTASLRIWLIKEFPYHVKEEVGNDPKSSGAELELLWNTAKEKADPFFFKRIMLNHPNTPPHIRQEAMNY